MFDLFDFTPVEGDPFEDKPDPQPQGPLTPSAAGGMPLSQADRDNLIKTVYGEAGNQPVMGQAGVAHAIMNRLTAGGYGDTLSDIVKAPAAGVNPSKGYHEFSPWNPPGVPESNMVAQNLSPSNADPRLRKAYADIGGIVDKSWNNLIPDPTGGATHYYGYMPQPPKWAAPLAAQNKVKIGGQTFVGGSTGPGQTIPNELTGGNYDVGEMYD